MAGKRSLASGDLPAASTKRKKGGMAALKQRSLEDEQRERDAIMSAPIIPEALTAVPELYQAPGTIANHALWARRAAEHLADVLKKEALVPPLSISLPCHL
ncbi:hypothetical protein IMZ48_27820 [Candidatus Bathyarchaeota archaeon]|nr:hypothetical protein [Candidatus Bathyarchaeota archaeon]